MDTITLGDHKSIPVVPQRHARLRRHLTGEMLQRLMTKDYSTEAYRTLCVLVPAVQNIPLWEWEGYGSQEAMENDNYEENLDRSPTTAEIVNAFEVALMVSGAGRLGKIIDLVGSAGTLIQTSKTQTPTVPSPASLGNGGE